MPTRVEQAFDMEAGRARVTATPSGPVDPGTLEIGLSRVDRGSPQHLDPSAGGEGQAWAAGERWFAPEAARAGDGSLVFEVGPAVTWRLKPHTTYVLHLRDGRGARLEDRLTWIPIRLPSTPPDPQPLEPERPSPAPEEPAAPQGPGDEDPLAAFADLARAGAAPATPPPPEPEPVAEAEPQPPPPPPGLAAEARRHRVALVAALALLLMAGTGYAAYTYLGREPAEVAAVPVPAVPAPAEPEAPAVAMTVQGARDYIIKAKPGAADAAAMARRFADAGAVEGAFLLRQHAARNGDAASAAELGRLYDPKFFAPDKSPVASASADRAVDWYERAAEAGDLDATRRLAELLKDSSVSRPDAPERAAFWSRRAAEAAGPSQEAKP